MKKVFLCSNCHSDQVETKMWVGINSKIITNACLENEDEDNYCPDCGQHTGVYEAELENDAEVIGFQVVSNDDSGDIHPKMDASFCIYSLSQCEEMVDNDFWRLLAIYTNDIEEPTMMFEGDPRG